MKSRKEQPFTREEDLVALDSALEHDKRFVASGKIFVKPVRIIFVWVGPFGH